MLSGVYKIQHKETGRLYIGSSLNVYERLKKHKQALRKNIHANKALQNGYNVYGEDAFDFEKIVVCAPKDLLMYEQRVIDGYKANVKPFGYNIRKIATSNAGLLSNKRIDLTGKKFGMLTFLSVHSRIENKNRWICRCDCGTEKVIDAATVKAGSTASCGCLKKKMMSDKMKQPHSAGVKYGMLTLVNYAGVKDYDQIWLCKCDCGKEKEVIVSALARGEIKSCGCKRGKTITHGMAGTRVYQAWNRMKVKAKKIENGMCAEWKDFNKFFSDMGKRPEKGELLRKDRSLPYSKDNCFWGTDRDVCRGVERNRYVIIQGKQVLLADACKILEIDRSSINLRARRKGETYQQAADHFYRKKFVA